MFDVSFECQKHGLLTNRKNSEWNVSVTQTLLILVKIIIYFWRFLWDNKTFVMVSPPIYVFHLGSVIHLSLTTTTKSQKYNNTLDTKLLRRKLLLCQWLAYQLQ